MHDFVSTRRVQIVAWAASLPILWLVLSSGEPWAAVVWLGALGFLLVSSPALFLGGSTPATIVHASEAARKGRQS